MITTLLSRCCCRCWWWWWRCCWRARLDAKTEFIRTTRTRAHTHTRASVCAGGKLARAVLAGCTLGTYTHTRTHAHGRSAPGEHYYPDLLSHFLRRRRRSTVWKTSTQCAHNQNSRGQHRTRGGAPIDYLCCAARKGQMASALSTETGNTKKIHRQPQQ